jgi:hypothetical protein
MRLSAVFSIVDDELLICPASLVLNRILKAARVSTREPYCVPHWLRSILTIIAAPHRRAGQS